MVTTNVEYLDFSVGKGTRDYRLRVRRGAESHEVTIAIPMEAFLSGRVRYQDAPDICFLKVQREIEGREDLGFPTRALALTDEEFEEYKVSHTPKGVRRSW
jgi:hypothetical protein